MQPADIPYRAPDPVPRFLPRLLQHWGALFRLAWPVMLARAGIFTLSLADIVMVGRYDTAALAHLSMGYAVFFPVMITGVGAMTGIVAETARHAGAGDGQAGAATWRRGIAWALSVGLVCTVLALFSETWLRLIGQAPDLAIGGGSAARWLAPGAVLQILFVASSFYLEGRSKPLPGLVLMGCANLVNIAGNLLLIDGAAGLPAMGAEGAALASTAARAVMAIGIIAYILRLREVRALPRSGFWGPGGWAAGRAIRIIGVSSGAAFFFETMAFAGLNQVAGLISPAALAAYTIAHQVEATVFMIALGLSVATAVRVGTARGAGDIAEARFAGWSGLSATAGTIALCAVFVVWKAPLLGAIFTSDPALLARLSPLFAILAISLVFDGGQVVAGQCNRALGDSWGTTLRFFIGFWLVMLPLGIVLGLHTPMGEQGLFLATALGCCTAMVLLSLRFHVLLRRLETRP
ncbi:MATE family efflux transporter [Paroceanicella profunda]|uniref:MATE family efflux transporter n=1 Tax=Paroceanicella profunda TaxID=2579971 RepID=A0A5B8FVK8_9RHOB|nr:MATE family efflux transporter [Paroceanicella profunda]QDL92846.1 MATE family efflux transporter [Paroceanicella profunda]